MELNRNQKEVIFRILCPSQRVGSVIGRGGTIVKALENESGASISIGAPVPECEERLITITAVEDTELRYSPAQNAAVLVFCRLIDAGVEKSPQSGSSNRSTVSARLLVPSNQVGCLLGKGGAIVSNMRKTTGTGIRIIEDDQVPKCASESDKVVQIEGDVLAVKRALVAVSFRLRDFQPVDKIQVSGSRPVESNSQETPHNLSVDLPSQRSVVLPTVPASSAASASGGLHIPVEADSNHAVELNRNQKEVIFRILCPSQRVGSVIGRGGTIVKALENESGASISIGAPVPECEERLITITAMEDTELRYSPAQNAAVLVFCRLIDAGFGKSPQSGSSNRSTVSARLLVPSNQVGCLLGKGGAIVSNIRKTTGTGIRIIEDDQVPKCASESDKVVQIEGDVLAVKRALVAVSFLLRDFQPIDKIQVSGSRPVESNSQETPHNLSVDLPSQRSVVLPTVPASSAASASGGLHIPVEADSNHAMELNRNQKEVIFRILCPSQRVGSVIGRGGTIVKALENESGASISIGAPVPECEERLITITAMEDTELRYSPAQNAAVLVFCRLIDAGFEKSPQSGSSNRSTVSARLLVPSNQVGCLLGKGGAIVSNIRKTTGTGIRIIEDDQVPKCASESDKVVQIEGDVLAVKRALVAVSFRLRDFQPIDKIQVSGSRPVESNSQETPHNLCVDLPSQRSVVLPTVPASSAASASGRLHFPVEADSNHAMELNRNQKEVIFRILCPSQRVGSVIGRGGTIVKALENESGASISIGAPVPECEERLITITAMEDTELRYSPAQNAAVLVFCRLIDAGVEKSPQSGSSYRSTVSARLLVPSNQVGCLLKNGGAIVSNIRKMTGTGIRIIGDDQVPKCASESDKVVQITGEIVNVEDAIFNVTGKLRENLFPRKLPDATGLRNISPLGNQSSPYNPESTRTSVGLYSGVPHNFNRPTALTQSHGHFGLSHTYDTPSESWSSQTIAGSRPRSTVDLGRGPASGRGGPQIGSENRLLVTNTTVEISVPESDVGAVYGENGSNLTRLRLISGAKVTVHEPRSGTTDRTVIISGTPDETQAAQSLLHAFILAGS